MPRLYAVADTAGRSVVEWMRTRAEAQRFIEEVRGGDDEDWRPISSSPS